MSDEHQERVPPDVLTRLTKMTDALLEILEELDQEAPDMKRITALASDGLRLR